MKKFVHTIIQSGAVLCQKVGIDFNSRNCNYIVRMVVCLTYQLEIVYSPREMKVYYNFSKIYIYYKKTWRQIIIQL